MPKRNPRPDSFVSINPLEARKQLYFQVQEEIAKKVPGAYLFSPKLIVFERANVEGLVVNSAPPLNEYWSVSKK
ncbi:hypothetical protein [Neorhizobium galegae]|uniref:hypothetical protein n=1 Tax=Neorhizobium galegae TaxID=399 RepID=UPI0017851193|nr:hypothetical protein [Neorhizobium galegae]